MINYSTSKINLSLSVLARRADGFHEVETVLYPIGGGLCDMVEMIKSADEFQFSSSGILVDCEVEENLCVKAYRLMRDEYSLPNVKLHLHKRIPFGAGLGAGSANAVAVIQLCDRLFKLNITDDRKEELAARLGSDTAFFVRNRAAVARGRGELLCPLDLDLSGHYIMLVKPDVGVSTAEAYSMITPSTPAILPSEAVKYPIKEWARVMRNDFEEPICEQLPTLAMIRGEMYRAGAIYSAMSGSGSTIFGIFKNPPALRFKHFTYTTKL